MSERSSEDPTPDQPASRPDDPGPAPRTAFGAFLWELRRRRVYRVAAAYAIVAWTLLQLGDIVVGPLGLPEWTMTFVIILLALGFPAALIAAWAFDITAKGIRRTLPLHPTGPANATEHAGGYRAPAYLGLALLVIVTTGGAILLLRASLGSGGPEASAATATHFIAVLPFANESPDPDDAYFANGVTDDILAHLSLVPDFSLISRTTTAGYRDTRLSIPEIASELGVGYLIEGNVRRIDNEVRISVRLVDGTSDRALWGSTYDRRLEDIFSLQTEIAQEVAGALRVRLSRGVEGRIERRPTEDLLAYDLFLQGREGFYPYSVEGSERAIDFFRRALDRDPDFALARAWLARTYIVYGFNFGMGRAWVDSAFVQSRRAAAEQPELADAHTAFGTALVARGRYTEGIPALERALTLNPNDWSAAGNLALAYAFGGAWDEGVRLTMRGLEMDARLTSPLNPNLSWLYRQLGMDDEADAVARATLVALPNDAFALGNVGWLAFHRGDRDMVVRTAERILSTGSDEPARRLRAAELLTWVGEVDRAREVLDDAYARAPTAQRLHMIGALHGYLLLSTGEHERADEVLRETEEQALDILRDGSEIPSAPYSLAAIRALRGDAEGAIDTLEEAYPGARTSPRDTGSDPLFESLRDNPRFQAYLRRIEADVSVMRNRVIRDGLVPR